MSVLDELMPEWDVRERHSRLVPASPEDAVAAATGVPFAPDGIVRVLFRVRGLSGGGSLDDALRALGFETLVSDTGVVVLGASGRPWSPRGHIGRFAAAPGQIRMLIEISATGAESGALLFTETRIAAMDAAARRAFRRYWFVIGPFSGLVRRLARRRRTRAAVIAVGLALLSAVLFGGMSVALRIALDRDRDVMLGTFVTVAAALVVALGWALAEAPDRGFHVTAAWPFALAGLLQPGVGQLFATLAIREAGSSRASMVFGTAPLVSVAIALVLLGEPASVPLLVGAVLIVGGSVELARERDRPAHLRRIGLAYAAVTVVLFSARDNLVRWLSGSTSAPPAVSASAALLGGLLLAAVVVRPHLSRRALVFVPAGICFGLSYVALFEAFYRGRVTVVSPLVATESLVGVGLSALLLRKSELVGRRLALGGVLIVAGGALIGATR